MIQAQKRCSEAAIDQGKLLPGGVGVGAAGREGEGGRELMGQVIGQNHFKTPLCHVAHIKDAMDSDSV